MIKSIEFGTLGTSAGTFSSVKSIVFQNYFNVDFILKSITVYAKTTSATVTNASIQIDILQNSETLYSTTTEVTASTTLEAYTFNPNIKIEKIYPITINIKTINNCQLATTTSYQNKAVDYLRSETYNSNVYYIFEINTDTAWIIDTDNYPVVFQCTEYCEPFEGFDDPYSILDAWKLDSNNNGYPWTFGWDAPSPPPTGNWYVKLSDGTFSNVVWYLKISNQLIPLNLSVHTSS